MEFSDIWLIEFVWALSLEVRHSVIVSAETSYCVYRHVLRHFKASPNPRSCINFTWPDPCNSTHQYFPSVTHTWIATTMFLSSSSSLRPQKLAYSIKQHNCLAHSFNKMRVHAWRIILLHNNPSITLTGICQRKTRIVFCTSWFIGFRRIA